jgi:hypothetical protein
VQSSKILLTRLTFDKLIASYNILS